MDASDLIKALQNTLRGGGRPHMENHRPHHYLRPEDFADALTGLTMVQHQEERDLVLVQQFFAVRGLVAERIPEITTKTPDFRILCEAAIVAYCEVKSPQDVFPKRVEDAILEGKGGVIEIGYGNDYRQGRCIARAAKKAEAQFEAVNPAHSVPNILIIVNHDSFSLEEDFTQVITGELGAVGRVGKPLRDDIPGIDVYVWMDARNNAIEQVHRLFRHENPLKATVRDLLKLG
jgi:hypothetical protein